MEKFKYLVPVEWSNQLVLTTAQLAKYYGCEPRHISDNFKRNESRFKEGKHHFRLEGETLKQFKASLINESGLLNGDYSAKNGLLNDDYSVLSGLVSSRAPSLYLWTERGAARHAKMLSTDKAWEVFEELEDFYFSRNTSAPAIPAPAAKKALKNPRRRAGQLKDSHVYVVLLSNNTVKIGNASDINERIKQIESKTNLKVLNHHYSPLMTRKSARLMEIYCQKIFSPYKTDGEFFSVNFEATCNAIDIIAKLFDAVSEIERGEKLLAIAEKLTDSPEKQHVLVSSANFIVGSKCD